MLLRLVAAAAALAAVAHVTTASEIFPGSTVGYNVGLVDSYEELSRGPRGGVLYAIRSNASRYTTDPFLLVLNGSRFDHGYDQGFLVGKGMLETGTALFSKLLGHSDLEPLEVDLVKLISLWQWDSYLSKQVPEVYMEELAGIKAGAEAAGASGAYEMAVAATVLANLPGTLSDLKYVLEDEWKHPDTTPASRLAAAHGIDMSDFIDSFKWEAFQCSMFGVWGSRSEGGELFSGRNLDWLSDSGINRNKLITVYKPPNAIAHATVGFAGLVGAITGMSAQGITVHEANLEEKPETFRGFPWILRLRWIMENAVTIEDAQAMWAASNNTVGFNHMVGSAASKRAMVMETQAWYTAYFNDNDPRESNTFWTSPSGEKVQMGFPLKDAVWRTNHGYDPQIRRDFLWKYDPTCDSQVRYMILHDAIATYESEGVPVGPAQAINLTAIVGAKQPDFYHCDGTHKGDNVISVAFDPSHLVMYTAWEAGFNTTYLPAACGTYLVMDMGSLFN